jgi:hypothetical protein
MRNTINVLRVKCISNGGLEDGMHVMEISRVSRKCVTAVMFCFKNTAECYSP